ncbi:MAG: DUF262 domain-containing HNH endonuclease family protein [Planctomycetes bacterium]|nr:DUF262 domain-containing HNH endonuclease family protein [Planctomycetota bacterium]
MKATAAPVLGVFEKKMRLEVPLFQRQYVWTREQQWEPLWEDISRKFVEYIEGRKDAPIHFLGAMVLDQKQTPTTHVERRQVIDGQQRLTTLQVFLAAFRDCCRENACDELARECEGFTANKGMMPNPDIDVFKIWPTQLDRAQFVAVMTAGSRAELERLYPVVRQKWARHDDPRPPMIEAYLYFSDELQEFFLGTESDPALSHEVPLADRLNECFTALRNALQVVVIDLEKDDDAQVIFETLNARGQPLLPADLLRNYIFLRAARAGEDQEALYETYWRGFDDQFWRDEVRQGRLSRPRGDLFMQHFLASRQTVDIPVKHLFVEYKFWIERRKPFSSIREELAAIARQRDDFRHILQPTPRDAVYSIARVVDTFDVRTAYPLLLFLSDKQISRTEWVAVARILESYIVRRMFCGWTTKNYNRVFLSLTKQLERDGATAPNLRKLLTEMRGESTEWPSDSQFERAWLTREVDGDQQPSKLVHILASLNVTYLDAKTEDVIVDSPLTVEHLMPRSWREHWSLPDGTSGIAADEVRTAVFGDPRMQATIFREKLVHTIGNLTLVTQPLNAALSNAPWEKKQPAIIEKSVLPMNLRLRSASTWDEAAIELRSKELLARALRIWPGPGRGD